MVSSFQSTPLGCLVSARAVLDAGSQAPGVASRSWQLLDAKVRRGRRGVQRMGRGKEEGKEEQAF